jgi:hypothetical protein
VPKKIKLELTLEERDKLEWARDNHDKPYIRERSAALIKIANGWSGRQVALKGLLKPRYLIQYMNGSSATNLTDLAGSSSDRDEVVSQPMLVSTLRKQRPGKNYCTSFAVNLVSSMWNAVVGHWQL